MTFWIRDSTGVQCNAPITDSTGFNVEEAVSIIGDFCRDASQQHINSENDYATLAKTALGDSSMNVSISYMSSLDCEGELIIDERSCEKAFYRILDTCGTHSDDNLGFYGGSVPSDCATFSVTPERDEIIRCGGNPSGNPLDMEVEIMNSAIEDYCDQSFELSPTPGDTNIFSLTVPHGQSYNNYMEDGVLIRTRAQFSEQAQEDCAEPKAFDTRGDECRRKLMAVRDKCGGEGGGVSENGVNGCVVWTMWGESLH